MVSAPRSDRNPASPPPAPPRLGPRPLAQHLGLAVTTWLNSAAAWPALNGAWRNSMQNPAASTLPGHLASRLAELAPSLEKSDPAELTQALQAEGRQRLGAFLKGVAAYRHHPYHRALAQSPILWDEGTTRLLDYRQASKQGAMARVLVIPSLVNRYYVLDLDPETSFLRWLDRNNLAPFAIDWDAPGAIERGFSLTDYVVRRLEGALDAVSRIPGGPIIVIGYCMGGNLALALALRRQAGLGGLVCLATPWDFHAENTAQAGMIGEIGRHLEPVLQVLGELPVDMLQSFFSGLDPFQILRKFQSFARLDPDSDQARRFVALEDWLNDGVSLAAPVARECLTGWYGANSPARLGWRIDGQIVDPGRLLCPSLHVIPGTDRIVPPGSALALAKASPGGDRLTPEIGHIGMMVGQSAQSLVWQRLADWIRERAA